MLKPNLSFVLKLADNENKDLQWHCLNNALYEPIFS